MRILQTIALCLIVIGCTAELTPVPELGVDLDRIGRQTDPLDTMQQGLMNGVYRVVRGTDLLGSTVSGRWVDGRWCLFAQHDVVAAESAGGFAGDTILLTGFVRIIRSGAGVSMDLTISPESGGRDLQQTIPPGILVLSGTASNGEVIRLERVRDRHQPPSPFHVIAHRGGGRNAERLGISENSIPMVLAAERLGATGIEIDVKQTRDGQIIVFHDDTFSPRTVSGAYLLGRIDAFDLDQIKRYGRLINGEPIPTLEEMLRVVVDSTSLRLVWVDVKDASGIRQMIQAQRDAMRHAEAVQREVVIALGIPTAAVRGAYLAAITGEPTPTISELDLATTLNSRTEMNCVAWAPRWTTSFSAQDIERCRSEGVDVFTWTLDVREYIAEYLYTTRVDGILSNYPSLVAGMEDTQ